MWVDEKGNGSTTNVHVTAIGAEKVNVLSLTADDLLEVERLLEDVELKRPKCSTPEKAATGFGLSLDSVTPAAEQPPHNLEEHDEHRHPKCKFQRIADVLAEHLNIRFGDVSDVSTAEEFAKLLEVAAMNSSAAACSEG